MAAHRRPDEFRAAARRLWDAGHTYEAIAERLGVTKGVIAGIADRDGWPQRRPSTRRIFA